MDGKTASSLLPAIVPSRRPYAPLWNAAALLAAALSASGAIHLLAYHLPSGSPLDLAWRTTALYLMVHCPLRGPLGLIVAIAVLAPFCAFSELRRLSHLSSALTSIAARRRIAMPLRGDRQPRSLRRLALLVGTLLVLQGIMSATLSLLCPMQVTMVMGGVPMSMAVAPVAPLLPLHVVMALVFGLLLWRYEIRVTALRRRIIAQLRVLARHGADAHVLPPRPRVLRLTAGLFHQALFARPPPSVQ